MTGHCSYCCYGSNLGYENPYFRDIIIHYHPNCPLHGHLAMELPGAGSESSKHARKADMAYDPANDWDEDDDYEYDDTKPQELDEEPDHLNRPDYIGIVSGAQYKLENAEGVTEYALAILANGETFLYEMADSDLRYLGRQIAGLIDE